MITIKHDLNTQ